MAPETTLRYHRLAVGDLQTNTYMLHAGGRGYVIDPGAEAGRILELLANEAIEPLAILLTHGHVDHSGAVAELLRRFPVPLLIHRGDAAMIGAFETREFARLLNLPLAPAPTRLLDDGETVGEGGLALTVHHTPGHTPGSAVFAAGSLLFTGDTLFRGDVGRTDLPGGSWAQLQESLEKLKRFPRDSVILPGHGDASVLAEELELNPYF
jgi:glyoxylase-like metal-dependent hydrolase (beta-lactamase superfamily II)